MGTITRTDVLELIRNVMEKRHILMPFDISELSENLNIKEVWDSIDYVEMIYGVENEFSFTAEDAEWGKVQTLGDFADVIIRHA